MLRGRYSNKVVVVPVVSSPPFRIISLLRSHDLQEEGARIVRASSKSCARFLQFVFASERTKGRGPIVFCRFLLAWWRWLSALKGEVSALDTSRLVLSCWCPQTVQNLHRFEIYAYDFRVSRCWLTTSGVVDRSTTSGVG